MKAESTCYSCPFFLQVLLLGIGLLSCLSGEVRGELQCPTSSSGRFGICPSNCDPRNSSSCHTGQLCCNNECGFTCVAAVNITLCRHRDGRIYNIGDTFTDDCNICVCLDDGTIDCTKTNCDRVNPLVCPHIDSSGEFSACLSECTHDSACTNGYKCCGSCPRRCVQPVRACNVSGTIYHINQTFMATDGCNECTCTNTGDVRCTTRSCVDPCQEEPDMDTQDCFRIQPLRYYYDIRFGMCRSYTPGCSSDSSNDFQTLEECSRICRPATSDCTEGLIRCLLNPCSGSLCPNFPKATCVSNYCGRCSAHFFLDGQNVTDICRNTTPTCPDGSPIVRCASNPCDSATCTSQPGARCIPDYCGRCGYRFVNASGHDVTRQCGRSLPLPVREPKCPNINGEFPSICSISCTRSSDCDDGQICCPTSCGGRTCLAASYVPYYPVPRTCPALNLRDFIGNCTTVKKCLNNSDCAYNQACCSSDCGKICRASSNEYSCSSVVDQIRESGITPPRGYYIPQCTDRGTFNATQCMVDGTCWCVDVNTGRPVSSYYPRGTSPNCLSCRYKSGEYAVGDKFRATDGCNQCSCTAGGVMCTLKACDLDTCLQRPEPGFCRGSFPAYFFNRTSQRCEKFTYGGCGGNSNRFPTISDCLNRCDNRSVCLLDRDSGPCDAISYQFYFNLRSERCEVFNYGGCPGNANRFSNGRECAAACNPDISVPSCATVCCAIPECDSGSELVNDDARCCPYCRRTGCDSSSQVTCSDGMCIDKDRRCDRIRDCSDGGDEKDCEEECEFRCGNGICIPRSQVCDRVLDCRDGRDETICDSRNFTGVVYLTPELALQCPVLEDTFCSRLRNCETNADCSGGTVCCDNQCGGRSCVTGNALNCRGIRHNQQQRKLPEAFIPVCQDDGSFNVTQCRENFCWCVDVNSGRPVSDGVELPAMPQCSVNMGQNNQIIRIGDIVTAPDGCNNCVYTSEGLICGHQRCINASCRIADLEIKSGERFIDDCINCECSSGALSCQRKPCAGVNMAVERKERYNVSLRMQGDFSRITDKDNFKREVIRTLLNYADATGLTQEQIEEISVKPGSVVVQIILVDTSSTTEGANATVIVYQMEQDFNSGVLIIRYDGQVLEPIPGGFDAASLDSNDDGSEGDSEIQGWHIALIVIGIILAFIIAVLTAVIIARYTIKKSGGTNISGEENEMDSM